MNRGKNKESTSPPTRSPKPAQSEQNFLSQHSPYLPVKDQHVQGHKYSSAGFAFQAYRPGLPG